jgi:hypothetical protein
MPGGAAHNGQSAPVAKSQCVTGAGGDVVGTVELVPFRADNSQSGTQLCRRSPVFVA